MRLSLTCHAGTLQVGGDLASTVWILRSVHPMDDVDHLTGLFHLVLPVMMIIPTGYITNLLGITHFCAMYIGWIW